MTGYEIVLPSFGLPNRHTSGDELRSAVLNGVTAENSKRNYALAWMSCRRSAETSDSLSLEHLILEFRSAMLDRHLSASTINVKLEAVRKLVEEARRAGVVGGEEAMRPTYPTFARAALASETG